jgi:hypothetical protein
MADPALGADEVEAASAAHVMIDARLASLPAGELDNFWKLVAKLYSRGVEYPTDNPHKVPLPAELAA